ncbi:hypothetical protein [Ferrovibrio terrae]|uniref:hypothetical protein n=1 Tax=Ferrovibrio terrae TaxID=2594003 RepID=UPI003137D416
MKIKLARKLTCLLLFVVLASCTKEIEVYKADGNQTAANAGALLQLAEGVEVAISMAPGDTGIGIFLSVILSNGTSLQLDSDELQLTVLPNGGEAVAHLSSFRFSHYGRNGKPGYFESFPATDTLKGLGRHDDIVTPNTQYLRNDRFGATAAFVAARPSRIRLTLPPMKVNGLSRKVSPLEFVLTSQVINVPLQ